MSKVFLPLLVALAACALPACAHHKKPNTAPHMYEGDAPTIHFSREREQAGGPMNTY